VVYPGKNRLSRQYLKNVEAEAQAIAHFFTEVRKIWHQDATPDRVIETCREQSFGAIHFGCHGGFESNDPDLAGLYLNGTLTVQKILTQLRFQNAPLVTLGACQTGIVDQQQGGDLTGLTQALFVAGADSIVASLWSVDDASTKALFAEFYKKRQEGNLTEAEALQYAIGEVQKDPRWEDPYYWGAFQLYGLPI
jgi:CHAT domain-containing protein